MGERENTVFPLPPKYQPMIADLRFSTSAMRIYIELDRIANHATNIIERVIFMAKALVIKHHTDAKAETRRV